MSRDLIEAARRGTLKNIQDLLNADVDVNSVDILGSALYCASGRNHLEMVELLIMRGADVELGDKTPLMEATIRGHIDIVRLLLQHKANINAQTVIGQTALHFAIDHGQVDIVKLLLEHNANYEIEGNNRITPLEIAMESNNAQIIKLFDEKVEADKKKSSAFACR